jgi:glycosyltransferase 2 family protein
MREGASRVLKVLAGLAVSAFFIWLTLRGGDGTSAKLAQLWSSLKAANYLYLLPYAAILTAIHFCRVVRWGILLEPVGKPSFQRLNGAGAVGFMALVIMPFRLGEFARPLLVAEKGRLRRSAAMASVVVERVVDGIAMAMVLIVALLFSHPATADEKDIGWVRAGGWIIFAFFFALLVFLVVAYAKRELAVNVVGRVTRLISARLAGRLAGMLDAFIGALKVVPDKRKILWFALLTVVYWGINGLGLALLARGFGLELGVVPAFTVLGVLVAGVMIPSGPGMLGTFQGAVIVGTRLFFPQPELQGAVQAYAWVAWGAQFGQQVLFGLYFLLTGKISFGSLWREQPPEDDAEESLRPALDPAEPGEAVSRAAPPTSG